MRVVVLYNPRSGRGLATRTARAIDAELSRRGHAGKLLAVGGDEALDPAKLATADALVVCGGDGSVSRVAAVCAVANVPLYHAPTGNENLFARALGTSRDPRRVVDHLERAPRARADLASCTDAGATGVAGAGTHNGSLDGVGHADSVKQEPQTEPQTETRSEPKTFLIMASAGPDAGVIRRVAAARTRAVGHLAYVMPVAAEVFRPALPRISCAVNGTTIAQGEKGILVVANTREYALGLDPARSARLDDGVLTAVFMPCASVAGGLAWLARCAVGADLAKAGARVASADSVRVELDPPAAWQIDGEWPRKSTDPAPTSTTLTLGVRPGALPVVRPG